MMAFTPPLLQPCHRPRQSSVATLSSATSLSNFKAISGRTRACMDNVDISPHRDENHDSMLSLFAGALNDALSPPPAPVVIVRKNLDQDFAVLLMRSGYNAVDELDFVAMDQFQKQFFRIRSNEWEKFIRSNLGMRQGIISDPRYFDFISYAQMLTIQFFVRDPRTVFEERYGDDNGNWGTRLVRRDVERLTGPADILDAWRRSVGRRIYQRLLDTVRRPQPLGNADRAQVLEGIGEIYNYMEIAGFCLKANVDTPENAKDTLHRVELVAPCILWGAKALRRKRSIPNDYDCFAVQAFCASSGLDVTYSTITSENSITRLWRVV